MNSADLQKLRGGYYTPAVVADWLSSWAAPLGTERILEPSCGDGVFLAACEQRSSSVDVTGIELDQGEAAKATAAHPRCRVLNEDFFTWLLEQRSPPEFDAVVGNPPFIRFQNFPPEYRDAAFRLMTEEGLRPTRLTNAWLPFVVGATRALREGGRLAMVLPAELLQVGYAADLRGYLSRKFAQLHLISFEDLIFPGILQETVLLLGVRKDCEAAIISTREVKDASFLYGTKGEDGSAAVALDHSREKWTKYYLEPKEIALLRECQGLPGLIPMGEVASVDVGIVTGRNEFFVLRPSEVATRKVVASTQPMIGRSAQVPGLMLNPRGWSSLHSSDGRVLLFNPQGAERADLDVAARRYVQYGEQLGFHRGYKCRIRLPAWWRVPSPWIPDAFLLRQIYDGPRVIVNNAGVTCTDTIHRVKFLPGIDAQRLAAAFSNSLTWAFSEVRGRSYGGGVLELEPREAESLPVPNLDESAKLDLAKLDDLQRRSGSQTVLDAVDSVVLTDLGLDKADRQRLREMWRKLAFRRGGRRVISKSPS